MSKPRILFGVCGIGHGHTFRQLPFIEHFAPSCDIVIFAYGESFDFYKKWFANQPSVTIEKVAVPFYVGNKDGLDFNATAQRAGNSTENHMEINCKAMAEAEKRLGKPDLIVSDYEPVSAQYAYAHNAPLVTLDQQSKYLCGDFPAPLGGQDFKDEIMRLRMFFPKADERLACSFFKVAKKADALEIVEICPPVLNDAITNLPRHPEKNNVSILMYISSQKPFGQSLEEITAICQSQPDVQFHLFGRGIPPLAASNLKTYEHGDPRFHDVLSICNGIVSTAGHTLLSEAMHLGIPVYAIPLPVYEQQMNACVIHENKFGISHPRFDAVVLGSFIKDLSIYTIAIETDQEVLLREAGQKKIVERLQQYLPSLVR